MAVQAIKHGDNAYGKMQEMTAAAKLLNTIMP
jgi:hypothetical protein